jgi:hypothetical protein
MLSYKLFGWSQPTICKVGGKATKTTTTNNLQAVKWWQEPLVEGAQLWHKECYPKKEGR